MNKHYVLAAVGAVSLMMFGGLVTFIAPVVTNAVIEQYDRSYPVWRQEVVTLVRRSGNEAVIYVEGDKARNCRLQRVWGQVEYTRRAYTDATVLRESGEAGFRLRPLGRQAIGNLIVSPVPDDATAIIVRVEHACGDRLVPSVLARLELAQ